MGLAEFAASIESHDLRRIFDCWLGAKGDARVPLWSAIDALGNPLMREHAWGWRWDAGRGELVSFFMGPKPREMYGGDPVGKTIREFYPPARSPDVERNLREVIETPLLQRAHGTVSWRQGRADIGERIVLPIRYADDEKPDAVLGAAVFDYTMLGAIARTDDPVRKIERTPF